MIYGYGQLAQALLDHGLVDQLNFVINPVMAGSGTTLSAPASARSCAWSRYRAPQRRSHLVLRKRQKDGERNRQGSPGGASRALSAVMAAIWQQVLLRRLRNRLRDMPSGRAPQPGAPPGGNPPHGHALA